MNSAERVCTSLSHREPDYLPADCGATPVSGIHVSCVAELRARLGLDQHPVRVTEPYQMLGEVEPDLADALGLDAVGVSPRKTLFGFTNEDWKPWRMPDGLEVMVAGKFEVEEEGSGDIVIYPEGDRTAPASGRMPGDGYFFDSIIRQQPIDEEKLTPEDNLEEFTPVNDEDIEYFRKATAAARATGRAVVTNFGGTALGDIALVPAPWMKHPKGIRDVAEWYMATSARRDYAHAVFHRQTDVAIANLERIAPAVAGNVDVIFLCGTDFGTQTSSFCSRRSFDELWLPYYSKLCSWIHSNTPWRIFKHSCGAVERFIPSFIEAGIEILNPVQCSATGMAAEGLKDKYGHHITFWGGGIDTQHLLPFGTPEQVQEQVLERCRTFAPHGGFVFNTIHNIQARTPVDNIVAMFEALKEFRARA